VYVTSGKDVVAWYEKNEALQGLRNSSVWQGFIRQLSTLLRVRAEDLELKGMSGQFLEEFVREAVAADAVIHYDLVHGPGGIVFSFVREKAPLLGAALPLLVRTVGTSAYRIESSPEPIIELRLQGMRLYLLQQSDRVLVASGLEGLLNVLAEPIAPPPALQGSVTAVLRTETYFDRFLNATVGKDSFPVTVSFDLSEKSMAVSEGVLPKALIYNTLGPSTQTGVLAAVPFDALGALVLSAHVPLDLPASEWTIPKSPPTAPGGISLVWDVSAEKGGIEVGIAVPAPEKAEASQVTMQDFLSDQAVSVACAGGAIWLGASSDRLLARMKDACEKQSLSVLDLKGMAPGALAEQQVSLLLNTSVWLKEVYRLGGGKSPREGAGEPEKKMVTALLEQIDALAKGLPVIGFTGKVVPPQDELRLKGFSVTVGGV